MGGLRSGIRNQGLIINVAITRFLFTNPPKLDTIYRKPGRKRKEREQPHADNPTGRLCPQSDAVSCQARANQGRAQLEASHDQQDCTGKTDSILLPGEDYLSTLDCAPG